MTEEQKAAHISGWYLLGGTAIVAIVGPALFLWLNTEKQPEVENPERIVEHPNPANSADRSALKFTEIRPIPHTVNWKTSLSGQDLGREDVSTFEFTVMNLGAEDIEVEKGELIVDSVNTVHRTTRTLAFQLLLSHEGHVRVPLTAIPKVGDAIPIPIDTVIPADAKRELVTWFVVNMPEQPSILYVKGRLRIYYGDQYTTSDPINIELHEDSHYIPEGPRIPKDYPRPATSSGLEIPVPEGMTIRLTPPSADKRSSGPTPPPVPAPAVD